MTKQLILNPVENMPELLIDKDYSKLRGLYISDKIKNDKIIKESIIGFSGRQNYNNEIQNIYKQWNKTMKSTYFSMRLLSGLHAHVTLFMGLGKIGDTVMVLPVSAGGHYATPKILSRLGYHVIEAIPDNQNYQINIEDTASLINKKRPEIIFIDRSEGLYYEDFSELLNKIKYKCIRIFDASQYLTNIIEKNFKNPFDMGFDVILSTLHKNFPGPQQALVCSNNSVIWEKIQNALSDYVSNIHAENIFIANQILKKQKILNIYSKLMLENSIYLEEELYKRKIPVVIRDNSKQNTHHLWIQFNNNDTAFAFYKKMEYCNFLVNYRKLPYELGMGIRMGTSAATLQGINSYNLEKLADLIAQIYYVDSVNETLLNKTQKYINELVPLSANVRN
ncbi:hypothetical protein [Faecalitalea cylindroides]|uniref:Glycine hydroxymethyltransferase n=1 Tax=Faecalitalea cylindroides ATCC 27803 TaxID=649755 RepID=U2P8E8_9FIRM|nr:hypothetical protein [Faecalitalea cylindroides]ERK46790.1 glycine hydroxymethyltransferase [[Eubacterium] cylindroides ATCC 27803] [Faecalitalea cylindroides ATCC 27803]